MEKNTLKLISTWFDWTFLRKQDFKNEPVHVDILQCILLGVFVFFLIILNSYLKQSTGWSSLSLSCG